MLAFSSAARLSRVALLTSAATASMVIAGAARAEERPSADNAVTYATGTVSTAPTSAVTDPSIVIAPPGTSVTDRDPTNVTGVGQMIIDQKNGFIGLCTGTLINPRTVVFAAHCVNETPAGTAADPSFGYGAAQGGQPIAFGFQTNNNVAGNSAFGHWLFGTNGGQAYQTAIKDYLYNVNQVQFNSHSLDFGLANNFYQADVAVASLDTPAANVPTWALLFSALPAPSSINNTTGTGYHVVLDGYGNTGTGTTGSNVQSDYRRRLAENYLGLLGSLDDIDIGLFGIAPRGRPQNLYQIDFDSSGNPNARSNQYDFNIFKDNALGGEGITGPGDSGGPLILDKTYGKQLVIGVLSGGTRYFAAQPSGSYGTSAFYQPLYLYWDFIAAANPYRYVSAVAGDGSWTDPTHWVTNVDPAYNILVNGQLVNGVPTTPGGGTTDTSGKFGQICDQEPNFQYDVCYDVRTGTYYDHGQPVTASVSEPNTQSAQAVRERDASVENYGGRATKLSITEAQDGTSAATGDNVQHTQDTQAVAALPAATLANGLPGATNFVPNNIDPNNTTRTNARYFDVTLSAAGTTTLNNAAITIDRFTLNGSAAKLTVNSGASLTSLININHLQGLVTNNGTISTVGDYLLLTGGITGSGRFNAPYFTSISGMFMPGTAGTIGTITFGGNLVLSSGSMLFIDLGPNGTSDKLAVVANGSSAGTVSLGGTVGFAPVPGYLIRAGDTYTILTTQGGYADGNRFNATSALSAILTPRFIYNTNSVQVTIDAGLYANVVSPTSPVQKAYAALLDGDRAGSYGALSDLYGPLDLQNAATIQATLESLAPRTETLKSAVGTVAVDNMSRLFRDRLAGLHPGALGGTVAIVGRPLMMASNAVNGFAVSDPVIGGQGNATVQEGRLPDNMSAFLAGGYLNGRSRPMPTAIPAGGRDTFNGYYVAGGIESEVGTHGVAGFALSYTNIDGTTAVQGQTAKGELYQGTGYGKWVGTGGLAFDATFSAGVLSTRTARTATIVGTTYRLSAVDHALALSGEIGIGQDIGMGSVKLTPRAALRGSLIDFSTVAESGGVPGLKIERHELDSLQGRAGATLSGGGMVKPFLSAYYVHDFADHPASFGANFVGGLGPNAVFALDGQDKDWGEISGGLTFSTGKIDLSVSADTTIERQDVRNQSYRGSITFHF